MCNSFISASEENAVVVGMHNRQQPDAYTERIRVTEVIQNAKFGRPPRQFSSDLMLLKLERPLTFNDAVSPVCLPTPFKSIAGGRRCYSTGWGTLRCKFSNNHNHCRGFLKSLTVIPSAVSSYNTRYCLGELISSIIKPFVLGERKSPTLHAAINFISQGKLVKVKVKYNPVYFSYFYYKIK